MAHWTTALRERMGQAPVVGVLEGGYRLDRLARLPERTAFPILQA